MKERWLSIYAWAVYVFLYLPILVLVVLSFNESRFSAQWKGFTLDWYVKLWQNDLLWQAAKNSLVVAAVTAVVTTVLSTMAALAMARQQLPGQLAVESLIYLPLVLPDLVLGVGALILYSALGIQLGLTTVLATHVGTSLSYVILVLKARLSGIDRSLEEAAADLGATPWQTTWRVTLPLLAPGILAGALLAFTLSLDDFLLSFFTAGPGATTLPLRVYGMVKVGITPEINALSSVLLLITGAATWGFGRLTRQKSGPGLTHLTKA
jgi:spermidine/putrescine transport system permease protein